MEIDNHRVGLLAERKPEFLGYDRLVVEDARVLAVLKNGALARRLDAGEEGEVVLDRTPFYGESGGQVGDHGVLSSDGSAAQVTDCQLPIPGLYVHHVKVTAGGFERGMTVRAEVDADPRLTNEVKREQVFYSDQSRVLSTFITVLGLTLTSVFSIGGSDSRYSTMASRSSGVSLLVLKDTTSPMPDPA